MSGDADRSKKVADSQAAAASKDAPGVEFKPPLQPHRGVFVALFIAFAAWAGFLLVLYFRTVYPLRHR